MKDLAFYTLCSLGLAASSLSCADNKKAFIAVVFICNCILGHYVTLVAWFQMLPGFLVVDQFLCVIIMI